MPLVKPRVAESLYQCCIYTTFFMNNAVCMQQFLCFCTAKLIHYGRLDAKVLNLLYSDKKKVGKLTKPDKIYMENTNLMYALAPTKVDIGTLRETFAVDSLSESHDVEYGKAQGDFKVDDMYTFEIGGRSKTFSQIAGVKDSYVFADDWDMPDGAKLPLWMLGFLY